MSENIHLLAIDVQNDFCTPKNPDTGKEAVLYVPNAYGDTEHLAVMFERAGEKINRIHVTLDSHQELHIGHAPMWIDENGKHPNQHTPISADDIENDVWRVVVEGEKQRVLQYARKLEEDGKRQIYIWPTHCVIGTWGHALAPAFADALSEWQIKNKSWGNYIVKGTNPWCEHYSALKAEVPDRFDPTTQINNRLVEALKKADALLVTGQALTHCVGETIRTLVEEFKTKELIEKIVLLIDTTSSVGGFEDEGEALIQEMLGRGMRIANSTEVLQG